MVRIGESSVFFFAYILCHLIFEIPFLLLVCACFPIMISCHAYVSSCPSLSSFLFLFPKAYFCIVVLMSISMGTPYLETIILCPDFMSTSLHHLSDW